MIVADTDVLIDFLAGQAPGAGAVAEHLGQGDLATTVITLYELFSGARTPRQQSVVTQLLKALLVLPLDDPAAETAAVVRRNLMTRGEDIGMADCLIAGIVLNGDGRLLTRNSRHFAAIEGLHLV